MSGQLPTLLLRLTTNFMPFVVVLLMITGCGGSYASDKPASAVMPVVRYINFQVYDPVYVAISQGFFQAHGIEVTIVGDVLGGPEALQAIAAGGAESGLASLPALINAVAAELPVIGVTDLQSSLPGSPLETWWVPVDSPIRSVKDFKGRTLAVNIWRSSFHYSLLMALADYQIHEGAVSFVQLPFAQQVEAALHGDVDVIGLMEPYTTHMQALYPGRFRQVLDAQAIFGNRQFTVHVVNQRWAHDHPDEARAFVKGIQDAVDWMHDHPDDTRHIIGAAIGFPPEHIPANYAMQPNARVVPEDAAFWVTYMYERGDLKMLLDVDKIVTNTYAGAEDLRSR